MKKVLAIILCLLIVFSFAACSKTTEKTEDGTTNQSQNLPSVEKVSVGNPLFVNVTNAKGEIEVTVKNDANHKNVKDTIKGNKITNGKDKLFLNHIAYVAVEDRWTATYNCDNIGEDATITFTPKDKSANLLGIMCKFKNASASYRGVEYDSITFAQDGKITLNGAKKALKYYSNIESKDGFGDISISGNIFEKANVTIKNEGGTKITISSDKDISGLTVNYTFNANNFETGKDGVKEPVDVIESSSKTAKTFTITIADNKVTIQ